MLMKRGLAVLGSALWLMPIVYAHEAETLFNVVHLRAQAEREIPNDQMTVVLVTEHEGADTARVADLVNTDMDWGLGAARRIKSVASRTRNYQTYPIHNRNAIVGWRASQEIELKSEDIAALSKLVGELQQKLQVRQMTFSPTDATRKRFEDELIEEAMQAFHARVAIVGKHMAQANHRIVNLEVNSGGFQPPAMYERTAMRTMAMDVAEPAVEAGTSKIVVTVSGAVQFF